MPKKKEIDSKALIKMIDGGAEQKDIMKKFGLKTSTQLKVAYTNALMDTGKVTEIKSSRGAGAVKEVSKEVAVGKRGSLILPKALVDEFGLQEGDSFFAKKTKAGISLSRKYNK
jgi:hypothetical protein